MSKTLEAIRAMVEHPNRRLMRRHLRAVAREIFAGKATTPQIASFLTALRMMGETGHEVEPFVEVMLENATPFERPSDDRLVVDTCGTGGDGMNTFNISTIVALIVAAGGISVAKHGNRSASSQCGSADVLEELGFNIEMPPEDSSRLLREKNFCFLFARQYHPAMRHAAPARGELKIRTLFNLCGPLANPALPTHQIIGVADPTLIEPMAQSLRALGRRGALIVHGSDGMDEISLCQVSEGVHLDENGRLHSWHLSPADLGLKPVEAAELVGGDAAQCSEILKEIADGGKGPKADIVNLNAGAVFWITGKVRDIGQGFAMARDIQQSAAPGKLLRELLAR